MGLKIPINYNCCCDKELIDKIVTPPYNEEAAVFLIYNRYDPLLRKIYFNVYENFSWYEDCQDDLFDYLKGKNADWHKLRTFEWKSQFSTWLRIIARNRFLAIKPYFLGKIRNPIYIDDDGYDGCHVELPDNTDGINEEREYQEKRILLLEAISLLKDKDEKFVVLKRLQGYKSKDIAVLMKKSWDKHQLKKQDSKGNLIIPSVGYVDVKYQRAKKNLKQLIDKLKEQDI